MIEFNVYAFVLVAVLLLMTKALLTRLMLPLEYRQITSHVPSATKTLWSEALVSWELATKKPEDLLPFFMNLVKTHGPVVHYSIAGQALVILNSPDDIKVLLSSKQHITKGHEYEMLKSWLNEGLLVSSGQKWQSRRKLLTSTFHLKTLHMYNPSIYKHSQVLADKLSALADTNKEINIMDYITLCSLDIICDTIMGTEMNAQGGKNVEYVNAIKCACKSVVERVFTFWLWNDLVFALSKCGRTFYKSLKIIHTYSDNVIKSKRASLSIKTSQREQGEQKTEETQKKSFLDVLLNILEDYPDQMTDKDIQEEVDTFLFEGHDTSAIAMTMTMVLLGLHQDIQDRVREELIGIFGDSARETTTEDLNDMNYLDAVIKESLRLYPSVPAFTRQLQTTLHLKNYNLPPMTTVQVYPFILHRTEDIFPKPEEFIPERFLDPDNKFKFLYAYLPFSAGVRNCIGQKYAMNQMKTVISSVLRKTRIETLGSRDDIKISMQVVIRVESLPNIKFHKI